MTPFLRSTFNPILVIFLVHCCIIPLSGGDKKIDSPSNSFMSRSTRHAISNIRNSIVNVRPRINWDKVDPIDQLVEAKDSDQLSKFYENVKSSRFFTERHRKALRSLLFRLDKEGNFERFMEKFRQVIRKPTGNRDALDFLQYIAPPGTGYSGILIEDGYVLTTHFAVSNEYMTELDIHLPGDRTVQGSVKGTYQDFDLALVEIPADQLPAEAEPISLSDLTSSQKTRVGHWAIAVGRGPRPEKISASRGIISATQLFSGRFLQTDAFCNYSNTGGALLNIEGEVIGMIRGVTLDNALFAGLNSGVNRAVKPAAIQQILPRLKRGEQIRSSFLGVQRAPGSNPDRGVRLNRVIEGCSAKKAGLKSGDILLTFGNKEIFKWRDLVNKIRRHMPGDKISVKVKRDGEVKTFEITLTSRKCMENQ